MTEAQLKNLTLETLVAKQQEAKTNLDAWKDLENKYREEIASRHMENSKIGTNNIKLGKGFTGKLVRKETISVTGTNEEIIAVEEQLGDNVAKMLFTWSAKMSKTIYDKLDTKEKVIVNRILTIKEAKPTFTVVTPKS